MSIGNRIKLVREAAGLSQRDLAALMPCSVGLVGQWESHRKKPGREKLRRLAEVLLVDPGYILSGTPSKSVPISKPIELAMLRRFRALSDRQQQNILELLGVTADVRREIEKQS